MRSSVLAGAFAFAGFSAAFSDSAPWIVASTAPFTKGALKSTIQTSATALRATKDFLSTCPTEKYVILTQPGLHYADLAVEGSGPFQQLLSVVDSEASKGKFIVPEVVGEAADSLDIKAHIEDSCRGKDKAWVMAHAEMPSVADARESRSKMLVDNEAEIANNVMPMLRSDNSYTLILLGTPATAHESTVYEPEFEDPVMTELKREVRAQPLKRADNQTDWDKLPLFEKYQFFTPGIFMGLLAVILIGSILTVGLKALSSLEVSYGAFEKDMGPAAQKKQQ